MPLLNNLRSHLPFGQSRTAAPADRPDLDALHLLEKAGFLIAEIDRSGLIQSANQKFCRVRGADQAEVIGNGLPYLVDAETRSMVTDLVHTVFAGLDGGEVVARLLTASGAPTPTIRWAVVPLHGPDGKIASALALGTDLTPHLPAPAPPVATDSADLDALQEEIERVEEEKRRLEKELKQIAAQPPAPAPPLPDDLTATDDGAPLTLAEIERRHIIHTLEETGNRISGPKGAANRLGLHANTLRSRMEKHGIALGA